MKNIIKEKRNIILIIIGVLLVISLASLILSRVINKNKLDESDPSGDIQESEPQYNGNPNMDDIPLPDVPDEG